MPNKSLTKLIRFSNTLTLLVLSWVYRNFGISLSACEGIFEVIAGLFRKLVGDYTYTLKITLTLLIALELPSFPKSLHA